MTDQTKAQRSNVPDRRRFLRSTGVALALPLLSSARKASSAANEASVPRRMILISNNLGVLPKPFFPNQTGFDYDLPPSLASLQRWRNDFTVFSGLSHPDVEGGHSTENCFLTAARGPTKSGFRNTISLDQFAAEKLGPVSRFPTLNLGVNIDKANRSLAWTRDGVLLPAEDSPAAMFRKMFVQGNAAEVQQTLQRLEQRASILDTLRDDMKTYRREHGTDDRQRFDQYATSIREVEQRLERLQQLERQPKPKTSQSEPVDIEDSRQFFEKFDLMLSLAALAIESDSTRIVTLMVDAFATPVFQLHPDEKSLEAYHSLSHHGQHPDKLRQLEDADRRQLQLLGKLIDRLASQSEGDERLLDRTMVLFGSNLGDANTHINTNLPILLSGGPFRHGQHLGFDPDKNRPLCNLFLTMLQSLGIEVDQFGSSDGTLGGFETR